jgi:hypothetical protein
MTEHHPHRRLRFKILARRGWFARLAIVVSFLAVAAACGGDENQASAGEDGSMTLEITSPGDGAMVEQPFEVEVDANVEFGEPDTGLHHWHLYFDGNFAEGEYAIVDDGGTTFTVDGLSSGEHTLEAVIANADHSLTDARQEITVTVGEGGGGTNEGDAPATTSDDGFDY